MKVLVSGSHGLIGSAVVGALQDGGHEVSRLVRGAAAPGDVHWSPADAEIDRAALEGHDAVIHLAGEPLDERWTARKRAEILSSRIVGTSLLTGELAALENPPSVFAAASAVGYYGDRGDEQLTEQSPRGDGFLADVVEQWEAAAEPARAAGIRTVHLRMGMVLAREGGALHRMLPFFRRGLGGRVASGRQYWAWISLQDAVQLFVRALEDEGVAGVYNAVGPEQVTSGQFTKTLAQVLRRPARLPAPALGLKLVYGQMADDMLLASQRVLPARLQQEGYEFVSPTLEQALRRELGVGEAVRS